MAVEYTGLFGKGPIKGQAKAKMKAAVKKIDRAPYEKKAARDRAKKAQGKDPVFGKKKVTTRTKNPVGRWT